MILRQEFPDAERRRLLLLAWSASTLRDDNDPELMSIIAKLSAPTTVLIAEREAAN